MNLKEVIRNYFTEQRVGVPTSRLRHHIILYHYHIFDV